jgi:hypothetical protein
MLALELVSRSTADVCSWTLEATMKRWLAKMAVTIVIAAAAGGVQAQCAGFTDTVDDGTGPLAFCPNVQWVKNRAITLGCTSATLYCPGNSVSRLAMAAFMNRLGKALTPEVVRRQASFAAAVLPGPAPAPAALRCITTPPLAAASYPRQAVVNASLSGLADVNTAAFRAFLLFSIDGGTNYTLFDSTLSLATRATAAPNAWANVALTEHLDLAPNATYVFAIGVRRDDVGPVTTGNFVESRCQLTATIFNRNGSGPPFDTE